MPLTRNAVALLILTVLSLPIAFVLGEYLGIKLDTGIETIPSTFIDPVLAFYSVPIRVTVAFLADVTPAAPLWIWTAIMFAGVLVQHFVLYGVTMRLIHFAKTPSMTPTSSMDLPPPDRVVLKDEANANRTTGVIEFAMNRMLKALIFDAAPTLVVAVFIAAIALNYRWQQGLRFHTFRLQ